MKSPIIKYKDREHRKDLINFEIAKLRLKREFDKTFIVSLIKNILLRLSKSLN